MRENWNLPKSVRIGGIRYRIRSDFRAIIDILIALGDPELEDSEKMEVMYRIFYVDWNKIPYKHKLEALEKASKFIDMNTSSEKRINVRIMDWEQDASILIPAINDTLGYEIRECEYLHWWTFMGGYMSMKDSIATMVISIRQKQAENKQLEKWEKDFVSKNRAMVELKNKYSKEQKKEMERIEKFL